MTDKATLLPCPHCGSVNLDDGEYASYDHEWEWRVICLDCGSATKAETKFLVKAIWNTRHQIERVVS
jgi:hypothetical protein